MYMYIAAREKRPELNVNACIRLLFKSISIFTNGID